MSQCKTTTKPRSGLIACSEFSVNPVIQSAATASLQSSVTFSIFGFSSVLMSPAVWQGTHEVYVENTEDVTAVLVSRAVPVQSPRSDVETLWVLNNIGPGAECCDLDDGGTGGTGNASITIVPTTVIENAVAATLGIGDAGFLLFNEETGTLKIWTGQSFSDTVPNNGATDCPDLDGGFANSTYLTTQVFEGGDSNG